MLNFYEDGISELRQAGGHCRSLPPRQGTLTHILSHTPQGGMEKPVDKSPPLTVASLPLFFKEIRSNIVPIDKFQELA